MSKKNWRPGGNELEYMRNELPPVSIEDRTVVGSDDRGLNSTNHIPEVGGSRNR